ncbi:secreted 45 kDa protein-like [Onthophagus taurus]|uniref:secreted 45 kDa protein-like n=1 Tax=Onthophagus taurus TaxID=166361 RepID=UPI000C2001CA|nr:uncharacterized protein LOC111414556 [Onthophagus taurus]
MLNIFVLIALFASVNGLNFDHFSSIGNSQQSYGKQGFSSGSSLKHIAQGSAEEAHNAAANQHTAARQAAFVAKSSLAQTAINAAARAQTALTGKEILRRTIQEQVDDTHQQLIAELQQLSLAQRAVAAAAEAYQQAQKQTNTLNAALNAAQGTLVHAQDALTQAQQEAASQKAMVRRAKQELNSLVQQLEAINSDYKATRTAAQKAEAFAQKAQANAAKAAAVANASVKNHGFDISDSSSFDTYVH